MTVENENKIRMKLLRRQFSV